MNASSFHRHRQARQGMVLLEVVIALTVFTLVAFSLVRTLDAAFDASKTRTEIDTAIRGLQNQMALLHSGPVVLMNRDLPDDNSGLTYHVTIEPAQFMDQKKQALGGIYRATITVKWKSSGLDEDRSVSELIFQP